MDGVSARYAAGIEYISRGWPVFVLGRSKRPVANCRTCRAPGHERTECDCLTCHGFYAATLDPGRLRAELSTVRRDGFAEAVDELEIGLAAIAAPVRGAGGEVVAALSITGPTVRMTDERIAELKPILIEEARTLSRRLGNPQQGEHAA